MPIRKWEACSHYKDNELNLASKSKHKINEYAITKHLIFI